MGRLIDADECPCILCKDTRNAHCTYEHRSCAKFCNWLNKTAYDVEKVVAELENFSLDTTPHCNEVMREGLCDGISDCDYCKIQYAIDIVRKGGVNER